MTVWRIRFSRSSDHFWVNRMRMMPKAARLRANGSLSPVGCSPMPKMPIRVSSRSAIATVAPMMLSGSWSFA